MGIFKKEEMIYKWGEEIMRKFRRFNGKGLWSGSYKGKVNPKKAHKRGYSVRNVRKGGKWVHYVREDR